MSQENFLRDLAERMARIEVRIDSVDQKLSPMSGMGERLVEIESRSKSNTHRIDALEESLREQERQSLQRAGIAATIVSIVIGAVFSLLSLFAKT